ncbi:MAG: nucleotidyltransferase family protein [Caldilineaceae bacterium]|nr:nucleotidyltransferase family protein [Caldilineaceae bacterium]
MCKLLNLCTCPQLDSKRRHSLAQSAIQFTDWSTLPSRAEEQGLGPLVFSYLRQAHVTLPSKAQVALHGLYLRHRRTNEIRSQLLTQIATEFQQQGIEFIVLKGAILAHLIYAEPGLRPMRDIDLLVRKSDILHARKLLIKLGFTVPLDEKIRLLPDKHLEVASLKSGGIVNSLELHYNLFNSYQPHSLTFEELRPNRTLAHYNGTELQGLGPEDMLFHLCEHILLHANVWEPIRLIWIVDIVGYAENFVDRIDWEYICHQRPSVLKLLSIFHAICPLSERLLNTCRVSIGAPPQGIGEDFRGWPRHSLAKLAGKPYQEILDDTFFPSEWWLRIRYRLDGVQPLFAYRWLLHPLYILGPFYLLEKLHLFWHLSLQPLLSYHRINNETSNT